MVECLGKHLRELVAVGVRLLELVGGDTGPAVALTVDLGLHLVEQLALPVQPLSVSRGMASTVRIVVAESGRLERD